MVGQPFSEAELAPLLNEGVKVFVREPNTVMAPHR